MTITLLKYEFKLITEEAVRLFILYNTSALVQFTGTGTIFCQQLTFSPSAKCCE